MQCNAMQVRELNGLPSLQYQKVMWRQQCNAIKRNVMHCNAVRFSEMQCMTSYSAMPLSKIE